MSGNVKGQGGSDECQDVDINENPEEPPHRRERSPSAMSHSSGVLEWDPSADVGAMNVSSLSGSKNEQQNELSTLQRQISEVKVLYVGPSYDLEGGQSNSRSSSGSSHSQKSKPGTSSTPSGSPVPLANLQISPVPPEAPSSSNVEKDSNANVVERPNEKVEESQNTKETPPFTLSSDDNNEGKRTPSGRFVSEASTDWEYDQEKHHPSKSLSNWQTSGVTRSEIAYQNKKNSGSSTSMASSVFLLKVDANVSNRNLARETPLDKAKFRGKVDKYAKESKDTPGIDPREVAEIDRKLQKYFIRRQASQERQQDLGSSESVSDPSSMCVLVENFTKLLDNYPSKENVKYSVLEKHRDYHLMKVWNQISKLEKLNLNLMSCKHRSPGKPKAKRSGRMPAKSNKKDSDDMPNFYTDRDAWIDEVKARLERLCLKEKDPNPPSRPYSRPLKSTSSKPMLKREESSGRALTASADELAELLAKHRIREPTSKPGPSESSKNSKKLATQRKSAMVQTSSRETEVEVNLNRNRDALTQMSRIFDQMERYSKKQRPRSPVRHDRATEYSSEPLSTKTYVKKGDAAVQTRSSAMLRTNSANLLTYPPFVLGPESSSQNNIPVRENSQKRMYSSSPSTSEELNEQDSSEPKSSSCPSDYRITNPLVDELVSLLVGKVKEDFMRASGIPFPKEMLSASTSANLNAPDRGHPKDCRRNSSRSSSSSQAQAPEPPPKVRSPVGFFVPFYANETAEEAEARAAVANGPNEVLTRFHLKQDENGLWKHDLSNPMTMQEMLKAYNPNCYKSIQYRDEFLMNIKKDRMAYSETFLRDLLDSDLTLEEMGKCLDRHFMRASAEEKRRLKIYWDRYVEAQNFKKNVREDHIIPLQEMKDRTARLRRKDSVDIERKKKEAEVRRRVDSRMMQKDFSTNLRRFQRMGKIDVPDRMKLGNMNYMNF